MSSINKAAAAGIIFFSVILAGFVGIKVDQSTIALLGGAFIGLVVAIPTTVLIMVIGLRNPSAPVQRVQPTPEPPAPPVQPVQHVTNNYFVVIVPSDAEAWELRELAATQLHMTPLSAQRLINAGQVQFVRELTAAKS
jgi:hypothetical protein